MQERPSRARDIVRRLSALREESSNSKSQPPLLGDASPGCCGCLLRLLPRSRRRRPNRPHNSNDVKVELQDAPTAKRKSAVGLDDFVVEAVLGSGMFATVALVSDKDSGEQFALKSLNKRQVVARYQVKAAKAEREILRQGGAHPFLVQLHYAFESEHCLHFVLDYAPGGDLYDRLEEEGTFPLPRARLYAAELSIALGHLHDALGVIYRDVKPDNVLLDAAGHAMLTDFGLSKQADTAVTFVGTPEYIAPEVIKSVPHTKAADWWGLGVLLYEFLHGRTPFGSHANVAIVQRNILKQEVEYDDGVDADAIALLRRLLDRDAAARLGAGPSGTKDVQAAPFWAPLDWASVIAKKATPGWVPPPRQPTRKSQQPEVDDAMPEDDPDEPLPDEVDGTLFEDFAYRRATVGAADLQKALRRSRAESRSYPRPGASNTNTPRTSLGDAPDEVS